MGLLPPERLLDALTWRELDILSLLAERRTDREIARALGLELSTVKWYNREIYSKLAVESRREAVKRAAEMGLLSDAPSGPLRSRHNLPAQITPLVGREVAVDEVASLIRDMRLVTLTGTGGIGKTRLGIEAARQVIEDFAHGVWFVELALLNDPRGVPAAIASALGLQDVPSRDSLKTLQDYLHGRHLLLVLDNFEHLLEAAPLVADLLAAAPDLKVLASSREALHLYGEHAYAVSPLSRQAATQLFLQRARAAHPGLELEDGANALVADVCRHLDGLPLAIELAAARTRLMPLETLRDQMSDRLALLKDGPRDAHARQQTLRATIDWSYNLLDAEQQALFARLSVFQGGRTVEAVTDVCLDGLNLSASEGLEALVSKGLLGWEEGPQGAPRFVMLESIHAYGREKLNERGETEAMRRRHTEYYATLAEQVARHLFGGSHQLRWLARFEAEYDNLLTALAWSLEGGGDPEPGMRLVGSLDYFWFRQGHHRDWAYWSGRALERSEGAPASLRARIWRVAGWAAWAHNDPTRAQPLLREALGIYRQLEDRLGIVLTMADLALPYYGYPVDYDEQQALCEEALVLARELGDPAVVIRTLAILGPVLLRQGDLLGTQAAHEECLELARQTGDRIRELVALGNLGYAARRLGDLPRSRDLYTQALQVGRSMGVLVTMPISTLAEYAGVIQQMGQLERAARLLAASEALNEAIGAILQPFTQPVFDEALAEVRAQMDPTRLEVVWAEGRAMSLDEAVDYALNANAGD